MSEYATIDQLHDEHIGDDLSEDQLLRVVQRASAAIELWTRRWFYPKAGTYLIDGKDHAILMLGPPIIAVTDIRVLAGDNTYISPSDERVDLRSVRIYNRHISQGLLEPDDRAAPKIQYLSAWSGTRRTNIFPSGFFPHGEQNIQVTGIFGYTDPDGGETLWTDGFTPVGKTPDSIVTACLMLAARDTLNLGDTEGRNEAAMANRLTSLRIRDQSITWGQTSSTAANSIGSSSIGPGIIGNSEIKALLAPYVRPQGLGAV